MKACEKGYSASEIITVNGNHFGLFTSTLLKTAELWANQNHRGKYETTRYCFDQAANYMKTNYQQCPQYEPDDLEYPFVFGSRMARKCTRK